MRYIKSVIGGGLALCALAGNSSYAGDFTVSPSGAGYQASNRFDIDFTKLDCWVHKVDRCRGWTE